MKITGCKNAGLSVLLLVCLASFASCAPKVSTGGTVSVITPDFFGIGEELAVQLTSGLRGAGGRRLLLTTVVDLDNFNEPTRFGRTLSEALSTSLFRHGFGVVEIRKASDILIRDNRGELMLTRDVRFLAGQQQAEAILVGTYSLTPGTVILNLKLIDAGSQEVMSVAGLELQRSRSINHLLAAGGAGLSDAPLSGRER